MKQQLQQRLQSLQSEFESGQKMLSELQAKQTDLQATLLRISGAIQVLTEVLEEPLNENPLDTPDESINGATPAQVLSTQLTS